MASLQPSHAVFLVLVLALVVVPIAAVVFVVTRRHLTSNEKILGCLLALVFPLVGSLAVLVIARQRDKAHAHEAKHHARRTPPLDAGRHA